jgi:FAD/FMN-containing dehydrogenase
MPIYKELTVEGWGRVTQGRGLIARPERIKDVFSIFTETTGRGICARGAGRSYGDCAVNSGGITILTERLARILSFDETTGEIAVEPGAKFKRLLDVFLPRGWLVPVSPGTYLPLGLEKPSWPQRHPCDDREAGICRYGNDMGHAGHVLGCPAGRCCARLPKRRRKRRRCPVRAMVLALDHADHLCHPRAHFQKIEPLKRKQDASWRP